jgi:hypothetical protein
LADWATGLAPGEVWETSQTLTFSSVTLEADQMALLDVPISIDAAGTLAFKLSSAAAGQILRVNVTLSDSGGTLYGGSDTSAPITLTIVGLSTASMYGLFAILGVAVVFVAAGIAIKMICFRNPAPAAEPTLGRRKSSRIVKAHSKSVLPRVASQRAPAGIELQITGVEGDDSMAPFERTTDDGDELVVPAETASVISSVHTDTGMLRAGEREDDYLDPPEIGVYEPRSRSASEVVQVVVDPR